MEGKADTFRDILVGAATMAVGSFLTFCGNLIYTHFVDHFPPLSTTLSIVILLVGTIGIVASVILRCVEKWIRHTSSHRKQLWIIGLCCFVLFAVGFVYTVNAANGAIVYRKTFTEQNIKHQRLDGHNLLDQYRLQGEYKSLELVIAGKFDGSFALQLAKQNGMTPEPLSIDGMLQAFDEYSLVNKPGSFPITSTFQKGDTILISVANTTTFTGTVTLELRGTKSKQ